MGSTEGKATSGRKTGDSAPAEGNAGGTGERSGSGGQPLMDLDFVRGLIAAVDESGIDSLEISRAGTRIKVSKTPPAAPSSGVVHMQAAAPAAVAAAPAAQPAAAGAGAAAARGEAKAEPAGSDLHEIKSPMVGTFYRAPAPDAPAYVEPGSNVIKGQTLCILEAMKLMNELESEVDGVVREVLVENAQPVEYGQVLFRVELSASGAK